MNSFILSFLVILCIASAQKKVAVTSNLLDICLDNNGPRWRALESCGQRFAICDSQIPKLGKCKNDMIFDEARQKCSFNEDLPECGGAKNQQNDQNQPHGKTEDDEKIPILIEDTRPPPRSCHEKQVGAYRNTLNACSQYYHMCHGNHISTVLNCLEGHLFDNRDHRCKLPKDIEECSKISEAGRVRKDTSQPKTLINDEQNDGFSCRGLAFGRHSDPENLCSNTYFMCGHHGQKVTMKCPMNTYYDAPLDQCNYYDQVPACTGMPRITTTTKFFVPNTLPPSYTEFDCVTNPEGNYPSGPCEEWFFICANGFSFRNDCGVPGLKYYHKVDQCVEPADNPGCKVRRG